MIATVKKVVRTPGVAKFIVTIYDSLLGALCMYGAIHWRYIVEEKPIPSNIDENAAIIFMVSIAIIWILTSMHKAMWRFTSLNDIKGLLQGVMLVSIITPVILFMFFGRAQDFPRSVPFIAGSLFFLALVLSRMIILFIQNGDIRAIFKGKNSSLPGAILIGTDSSLHKYLQDMDRKSSPAAFNILGLIDTDESNRGRSIRSHPILGSLDDIQPIYTDISNRERALPTLIATDTNSDRMRSYNLVKQASEMGAPLVRVSQNTSKALTPFEAADLIGRDVKALNINPVKRLISGKRVMITGAGGTIGSEITCQVAGLKPAKLTLVDASEFNLYEIDRKLGRDFSNEGAPFWFPYLANICDAKRMEDIFEQEKPEIILHAAALKHVHLSEVNPLEAIQTNVGGTRVLINMALKHRAESFTLISTDKAVNPSNVMGATKRVAELLTMAHEVSEAGMSTCAVRFGNVLGSTGSVVPLFEEQIANGGPVTVTHKDVDRFFMTTEEAAALVLQAAALNATLRSDNASIYVLEMGEPVKIAQLARQLIRLRGKVPDRDIKIEFTELRAGEKISERLVTNDEVLESTYVEGVKRISGNITDPRLVDRQARKLMTAVGERDEVAIKRALATLVPTYKYHGMMIPTVENPPQTSSAKIITLNEPKKRT